MTACVIDASAIVHALTQDPDLLMSLGERDCHAPHLVDAEVASALRRFERAEIISSERAASLRLTAEATVDVRYPEHGNLGTTAWQYRAAISMYDSYYVALATATGLPLLTRDAKLAAVAERWCSVELITEPDRRPPI